MVSGFFQGMSLVYELNNAVAMVWELGTNFGERRLYVSIISGEGFFALVDKIYIILWCCKFGP